MDWIPFVGEAHSGQPEAREQVGMEWNLLVQSPAFELAPAHIHRIFALGDVIPDGQ